MNILLNFIRKQKNNIYIVWLLIRYLFLFEPKNLEFYWNHVCEFYIKKTQST